MIEERVSVCTVCLEGPQASEVIWRKASTAWLMMLCLCAVLAGCASPKSVQFADPTKASSATLAAIETETILVATSRKPSGKGDFSAERSDKLEFSKYSVSIPPNHKVGQIEWPKGAPDLARNFAVVSDQSIDGLKGLKRQVNEKFKNPSVRSIDGKKEAMLFVHGYNTSFSAALYRTAQMKHDFEIKAPMTLFSWPSAGIPELYMYDRDSIKSSRDQLEAVVTALAQSDAQEVTLVAHSLGTELLMETLRQMARSNHGHLPKKLRTVILISPDLDIDVFNSQLAAIKTLPPAFAIFVSKKDQALRISSFLAGDKERVGNNIDETRIKRKGIVVVDVTEATGGDGLKHMTVITSPRLVAVLKGVARSGQRGLITRSGEQSSLSDQLVDVATLPFTFVIKTTEAIINH
ncbi:Esterase/lipase superfamily enzyme [Cohaesibacter sp. ES.047]|nr:Esterase/lipase superfamily enzyme [Cohaesibacter sp. ES.047]